MMKIKTLPFSRLQALQDRVGTAIDKTVCALWSALSFSLASDRIASKKCACICLDPHEPWGVTIAAGSRTLSRVKITAARHYSLAKNDAPSPSELADLCCQAAKDLHITKSEWILSVPKAWTITQVVDFPSSAREHLADVVFYEFDRLTPFTPDTAYYDFRILNEADGRLRVLLMAVRTELIDPYLATLQARAIDVRGLTCNLAGIAAYLNFTAGYSHGVFFDIRSSGFDGALIRNGLFSEWLGENFSGLSPTESMEQLVSTLNEAIERMKLEGNPTHVVIDADGVADIGLLGPRLAAPVKPLPRLPVKDANQSAVAIDSGLAAACGGAVESLRPGYADVAVNFLARGRRTTTPKPMLLPAIFVFIIIGLGLYALLFPMQIEQRKIEEIDRQISLRKQEVKKVENLRHEAAQLEQEVLTVDNFKNQSPLTLNLLKELTELLPKEAWLERVRITDTGVEVEGYTNSPSQLLSKLEGSKYFRKAEFASAIVKNARMNSDRFTIKMEIKGARKLEVEKAPHGSEKKK